MSPILYPLGVILAPFSAKPQYFYLTPMYDIDALATKTLDFLLEKFPLGVQKGKSPLRWSTKVANPEIWWRPLGPEVYGYCLNQHRNRVMLLNSELWYTESLLVNTIAHEYRHMMQNLRQYRWLSLREGYSYWKHPLEKDARAFAEYITARLGYPPADL